MTRERVEAKREMRPFGLFTFYLCECVSHSGGNTLENNMPANSVTRTLPEEDG